MTLPEVLLWQHFRQRPHGLKFRNQHGTGAYVLDFYCSDARLAIEVDGLAHDNAERADHDRKRDSWLASHGIETLRIPASEVLADATQAAQAIVDFTRPRRHPPDAGYRRASTRTPPRRPFPPTPSNRIDSPPAPNSGTTTPSLA